MPHLCPYRAARFLPWLSHRRRALLISGAEGAPMRYRSEHMAEELRFLGWSAVVIPATATEEEAPVKNFDLIILHRVRMSSGVRRLIEAAKSSGCTVLFDIDDRIFDEEHLSFFRGRELLSGREDWIARVREHRATISMCDGVLVSTEGLERETRKRFPGMPVLVHRNALSRAELRLAQEALRGRPPRDGFLRISYTSGSSTHDVDVLACAEALGRLLEAYSQLRLLIVGVLDLPRSIEKFGNRIERVPFVPWQELLSIICNADIAVAPLEMPNPFTEAKSENKFLEAGIVGVPIAASPTESFRRVIRHGENGMLCQTSEEWFSALDELIRSKSMRGRLGRRAREDILESQTTRHRARELGTAIAVLAPSI